MFAFARLRTALSFLTVLPVGGTGWTPSAQLARSVGYFPIVGLLIGLGCAIILTVFDGMLGHNVASALVVLFLVVITGGLHIDGLADTADGFAGTRTRERRLEIMRSGTSGPAGVAAVTLALLLKYSLLVGIFGTPRLAAALLVPALARWPMVVLVWGQPAAREEGLGQAFAGRVSVANLLFSTGVVIALSGATAYVWGFRYLIAAPALVLIAWLAAVVSRRLLGGVTGDTLGATVESSEILLLGIFLVIQ